MDKNINKIKINNILHSKIIIGSIIGGFLLLVAGLGIYFGLFYNKKRSSSSITPECLKDCENCSNVLMCTKNDKCKFDGVGCISKVNKVKCSVNCGSNGTCNTNTGKCDCIDGYTGPDCTDKKCTIACNKNQKCSDGKCICKPGYKGTDCTDKKCTIACNKNQKCSDGKCICKPGYKGTDCMDINCPNNCNNNGACNFKTGKCTCFEGYSGDDCSDLEGFVYDSVTKKMF